MRGQSFSFPAGFRPNLPQVLLCAWEINEQETVVHVINPRYPVEPRFGKRENAESCCETLSSIRWRRGFKGGFKGEEENIGAPYLPFTC